MNSLVVAIFIFGCTHQEVKLLNSSGAKIRFQNLFNLELTHGGCSIRNHGGLVRLCEYDARNPADLKLHIGPSLSKVWDETPISNLHEVRTLLWKEWVRQGVFAYSVDAADLFPSLNAFDAVTGQSLIKRVSSNLMKRDGESYLFEPFVEVTLGGKKLTFLSFSESSPSGTDWQVGPIEKAFLRVVAMAAPESSKPVYVLGSLKMETRSILTSLSKQPLVFLGGELKEANTVAFEQESERSFRVKAADLGRGIGELTIAISANGVVSHLATDHTFRSVILRSSELNIENAACLLLQERMDTVLAPKSCSLEAVGSCDHYEKPEGK